MSRPSSITPEQIKLWDENINGDANLPSIFKGAESPLKEIIYAGLWLAESLIELECKEELIVQFQYTHGQLSFGKEPWGVAEMLLTSYIDNTYEMSN